MYLILHGDPKQDQQEKSLLKSIMLYFGMWLISMTINKATKQTQRKAFISHQDDSSDGFKHGSEEEDSTNDTNQNEPFPYSVFQSSFNRT